MPGLPGNVARAHPAGNRLRRCTVNSIGSAYCINGMIMQAKELLDANKHPSEEDIRKALANNLCRCGTHVRIVRAIKRASEMIA